MTKSDLELANMLRKGFNTSHEALTEAYLKELVHQLQTAWNVCFPAIYISFLGNVGRQASSLFLADMVEIESLEDLQSQAWTWANENQVEVGPVPIFFFYGHHGYEFAFFRDDGSADPPAFAISDSHKVPQLIDENLSGALYQLIERACEETTFIRERASRRTRGQ